MNGTVEAGGPRPAADEAAGRRWAVLGALSGGLAVAAGAFGAHAMKAAFAADVLVTWETAARYQMYHALALVALAALACRQRPSGALRVAGWLFVAGTVLFSGSLYALVLTGLRPLAMVTPLGGVAFIAGWACLAWGAMRGR